MSRILHHHDDPVPGLLLVPALVPISVMECPSLVSIIYFAFYVLLYAECMLLHFVLLLYLTCYCIKNISQRFRVWKVHNQDTSI